MKTVIWNTQTGEVLNVGEGEAGSAPPPGIAYDTVEDSVRVGPGWTRTAEGAYLAPTSSPSP